MEVERRKLSAWILAKLFRVSIHFYITGGDEMAWLRWGIRAIIAVAAVHVIIFLLMLIKFLSA